MENDRNVEIRYQNCTGYVCTVCVYIYIASISLCDSWSFPLKNRQDLMACRHGNLAQDLIAIMDEAKRPIDNSTKERFGGQGAVRMVANQDNQGLKMRNDDWGNIKSYPVASC